MWACANTAAGAGRTPDIAAVADPFTGAALVAGAALGLPLLFVLYLRESGTFRDLPLSTLLLTAALGAALGIGWGLLIGAYTAASYEVPLGAGLTA